MDLIKSFGRLILEETSYSKKPWVKRNFKYTKKSDEQIKIYLIGKYRLNICFFFFFQQINQIV